MNPKEKIFAHDFPAAQILKIAVRRGDNPHVGLFDARVADGREFPFIKDAQKLDLHGGRQFAQFIEKKRPFVRDGEKALLIPKRARERAAPVSEKLAFKQILRDRAAVDGKKFVVMPLAHIVNRAGNQLFARAGFAVNKDARVGGGGFHHLLVNLLHGRAFPDNAAEAVPLFHRRFQRGKLFSQAFSLIFQRDILQFMLRNIFDGQQRRGLRFPVHRSEFPFNPERPPCFRDALRQKRPRHARGFDFIENRPHVIPVFLMNQAERVNADHLPVGKAEQHG